MSFDVPSALRAAAILLLLAAGGGLVMLWHRFGRKLNPPAWLAMAHGFLAAAAITLILFAWWAAGVPDGTRIGVVVLLAASAGGIVLNLRDHWRHVLLSKPWVIGHFLLALLGTFFVARDAFGF